MNRLHNPDSVAAPFSNYSQGVEMMQNAHIMFVAGQVGVDPDGNVAEGFEAQAERAFQNVGEVLSSAAMDFEDVSRMHVYLVNQEDVPEFRDIRDRVMGLARPASTLVVVEGLADPSWLVQIETVAARRMYFWSDGGLQPSTRGPLGV